MTITQLEYIIAVEDTKSFAKASLKCHVTQPTLSVQIKKLEEELGVVLFDRSKKPVITTEIGLQIIEQARVVTTELKSIHSIIEYNQNFSSGELRLGVIPTISPYLLPLFALEFANKFPDINFTIKELKTEEIIYDLHNGNLDLGLLVSSDKYADFIETPLYHEPFVAYVCESHPLSQHKEIQYQDLDLDSMWLLKEGHCFRNQVINICGESINKENKNSIQFESGSLETIRRIVEQQHGYTLLPKLATLDLNAQQNKLVREFQHPQPTRKVSLIRSRRFMRRNIVESLKQVILDNLPMDLLKDEGKVIHW